MLDQLGKVSCVKDAVELAWLGASTNQEACDAMLEIMRNDTNVLSIMIEPHLGRIAMDAVSSSKRAQRKNIWASRPVESNKGKQTQETQAWSRPVEPDNRVKYVAQANMRTLMDMRLPCGKRLGDAVKEDLSEAIISYRKLQKSNGEKADFYTKILGKVEGDKRVVDVWTPAELEGLKETVKE